MPSVLGRRLPLVGVAAVVLGVLVATSRVETAVRPPKFQYELHTLDNGLTVILSEDHSTPIVHSRLVYKVGSS